MLFGLVFMVFTCGTAAQSDGYTGYPFMQPYQPYGPYSQPWPESYPPAQYHDAPLKPKPKPKLPPVPGSPLWKKLQFIKKYQAYQRSRTSDIQYGPKSAGKTKFETMALEHHNNHRQLHQVPNLVLDHELSKKAAKYAMKLARDMKIAHAKAKDRPNQSENIAVGCKASGPGMTEFEAVKYWYQTICNQNWNTKAPNDKSRPFTNVIWKNSKKFGIGYASFKTQDKFNCTVIVARYSPEGSTDVSQDYVKNVKQGLFVPTSCQYVNDRDRPEFLQPALQDCKPTKDFHGQMVELRSSCTFNQLFSAFGASRRKGKLSLRVVL